MALTAKEKEWLREIICEASGLSRRVTPQLLEEYSLRTDEAIRSEISTFKQTKIDSLQANKQSNLDAAAIAQAKIDSILQDM